MYKMETYKDICKAVENGATITITSHYGNKRTYFKNNKGEIRQKFNNCSDTYFYGLDTRINSLYLQNMVIT